MFDYRGHQVLIEDLLEIRYNKGGNYLRVVPQGKNSTHHEFQMPGIADIRLTLRDDTLDTLERMAPLDPRD